MCPTPQGVGFNLRLETLDEFLETPPDVPFVEIIVDNWFSGGPHHKKLERIRQDYELSFHCVGMNLGGSDPVDMSYLAKVHALKKVFVPFQVSDHLALQAHKGCFHHDLLPFPFSRAYLQNTVSRIGLVQDFLNETLLIENLSYYVEYKASTMTEWEFTSTVLKQSGCHLLLDFNNVWVNAQNLDLNIDKVMASIPWDRVREVHVAGAEIIQNLWVDTHGANVHEDILSLVRQHRDLLNGLPIVFEKDTNFKTLADFVSETVRLKAALSG